MRILIADGDSLRAKGLAEACMGRGHSVERVAHGAAALELALERLPEMVICPSDLPVIDALRLAEILRSNPRTRKANFIFLIKDESAEPQGLDPRDATVVAPWHAEDVLAHLDAVLERSGRLGAVRSDAEMEGNLSQISFPDLLQLFQMNRKSGTVRVNREERGGSGTILLRGGQVVDATVPLPDGTNVGGEKAFYRMLSWREGRFEFVPGDIPMGGRIRKPTRALLMEGMRQIDEWERQRRDLPGDDRRLRLLIARDRVPAGTHPLTRAVLDAVETFGRVRDVVDHCAFPDYQVLRVLGDLLRRRAVGVVADSLSDSKKRVREEALFTPSQQRRLREWASAQDLNAGPVIKVLALAANDAVLRLLQQSLTECPDFQPSAPLPGGGRTTLGHFPVGEGLSLRVLGLLADPLYSPLLDVAAHGLLGAIVLPKGPYGSALEATEPAFARLRELGCERVMHLLPAESAEQSLSDTAREQLGSLQGGTVFVLPASSVQERLAVLRNVFARIVP